MHIKNNMINNMANRIVSMLMCILLLSNIGMGITFATYSDGLDPVKTGYVNFGGSNVNCINTEIKNGKMIATYESIKESLGTEEYIEIIPNETAVYTITFYNDIQELDYHLFIYDDSAMGFYKEYYVPLAAKYTGTGNPAYTTLTKASISKSTSIDVVLVKGQPYHLKVIDFDYEGNVNVSVEKRNIQLGAIAASNVPSNYISAHRVEGGILTPEEYNAMVRDYYLNAGIKIVEFPPEFLDNFLDNVIDEEEGKKGGTFQKLLAELILMIGNTLMSIVEWILGSDVKLTIDNIIFNRFEQTQIDLSRLGGIQIGSSLSGGIFNDSEIGNIIEQVFNGLKKLTLVIYIVMLLYIGLKILLSVGGKNQSKYLKYIEYWITGLILLEVIPFILPAIPALNNSFVELMSTNAKKSYGSITIAEVLERLGGDASCLGEDAQIVEVEKLIDERVKELNEKIKNDNSDATREEAQNGIDNLINNVIEETLKDVVIDNMGNDAKSKARELARKAVDIVDKNYANWSDDNQKEYEEAIKELREYLCDNNNSISSNISNAQNKIGELIQFNSRDPGTLQGVIQPDISAIVRFLKRNAYNLFTNNSVEREYNSLYSKLKSDLNGAGTTYGLDPDVRFEIIDYVDNMKLNVYRISQDQYSNVEKLFVDYKHAVIKEEIEELKSIKEALMSDAMRILQEKATKQEYVVYAIAWAILLFQVFALLFMYYKRVIAIVILIVIFPLIMAFYVIDKMADGKSQSLEKWIKEFLAAIFVQTLHAAIYIILINVGIEVCSANPERYWFFLILTVCFLFPGERLLRSMLGLNSTMLGELRNNVGSAIVATYAVARTATNVVKKGKNFAKDGGIQGVKKKWEEELKQQEKKEAEEKKKKKKLQESKRKSREERERRIRENSATKMDKAFDGANKAKAATGKWVKNTSAKAGNWVRNNKLATTIKGVKGFQKTAELAKKVGSNAKKVGTGAIKLKNKYGKYGKFALKKASVAGLSTARKGVGLTAGALEGIESFGKEGMASGIIAAKGVARNIGGFKDVKSSPNEASRFTTGYSNGAKVQNKVKPNTRIQNGNVSSNKVNTKINITTNTNNDTSLTK